MTHAPPHRALALLLAGAVLACARGPGTEAGGPAPMDRGVATREAVEAIERVEALLEAGRYGDAAGRADSLYAAWHDEPALATLAERALWLEARALEGSGDLDGALETLIMLLDRLDEARPLRRDAVARLAAILRSTGRDSAAVRLLLDEPEAAGAEQLSMMREAALRLPLEELEALAATYPLAPGPAAVLHAELARALALTDRLDSARRVARRLADTAEPGSDEAELADALATLEAGGIRLARIGVILPLTGRFASVGALLREGIELALEEHRSSAPGGFEVELVVEDDGSSPERAVELAERLGREGVLAVLGPVRSEPFAAAARARPDPRLLLVSPTATQPSPTPGVYTLWANEHRERAVAREVGTWIAGQLGLRRTAVLFPTTAAGRAAAEGFEEGVLERGGRVIGSQSYDPGLTTFAGPIAEVAVLEPDAVFVAAGSAPEVLQIASQLAYYGLDRSVIAGGPAWAEPAVVRRLEPFAADYRIVGAYVDRMSETSDWAHFREKYEREYRKSLRDNILPALGYDAFKLALAAVEAAGLALPGAVSRAATSLREIAGATGTLLVEPETSTVGRRTLIRMLLDGRLVQPDRSAVLAWLERARFRADSVARARADSISGAHQGREPPR